MIFVFKLTPARLESLMKFVRNNERLWSNNQDECSSNIVSRRKEAIDSLNTILVGDEEGKIDYLLFFFLSQKIFKIKLFKKKVYLNMFLLF